MNDFKSFILPCSWIRLPWIKSDRHAMETLTAFVRDAEHEILSVATTLQAQLDLMQHEHEQDRTLLPRFTALNRSVARLIADTNILAAISELTATPRIKGKQKLDKLVNEISSETDFAFRNSQVVISSNIAAGVSLDGSAEALKLMIKELVLTFLQECHILETMRITAKEGKRSVSLSFDTGTKDKTCKFVPWQLGKLRLSPANGEGISLAAIDAIAKLHKGQLSVKSLPNQRHEYQLNFESR